MLRSALEYLSFTATIFGSIFVGFQFWQLNELNKIENSMDFYYKYSQGEISVFRSKLRSTIIEIESKITLADTSTGINKEQKETAMRSYFFDPQGDGEVLQEALVQILLFYDEIDICIKAGLCDSFTICQFFGNRARAIRDDFHSIYAKELSAAFPGGLGRGLESIAMLDCNRLH